MTTSFCRGCANFDPDYRDCSLHNSPIRKVKDCEDYYNEEDINVILFGPDGPDDGFFNGD